MGRNPLSHVQKRSSCLDLECWVSAFDVSHAIVVDGVHVVVEEGVIASGDWADSVWTSVEAQSAESEFKLGAGAKQELTGGLGAAVEEDGHGEDGGCRGALDIDIAAVVAIAFAFLVVEVEPAVVTDESVVREPLTQGGVFVSAAGQDAGGLFSPATEPDLTQQIPELGNISAYVSCRAEKFKVNRQASW